MHMHEPETLIEQLILYCHAKAVWRFAAKEMWTACTSYDANLKLTYFCFQVNFPIASTSGMEKSGVHRFGLTIHNIDNKMDIAHRKVSQHK